MDLIRQILCDPMLQVVATALECSDAGTDSNSEMVCKISLIVPNILHLPHSIRGLE